MNDEQITRAEKDAAPYRMLRQDLQFELEDLEADRGLLARHVLALAAALREAVKERDEARRLLEQLDRRGALVFGDREDADAHIAAWKAKEDAKP